MADKCYDIRKMTVAEVKDLVWNNLSYQQWESLFYLKALGYKETAMHYRTRDSLLNKFLISERCDESGYYRLEVTMLGEWSLDNRRQYLLDENKHIYDEDFFGLRFEMFLISSGPNNVREMWYSGTEAGIEHLEQVFEKRNSNYFLDKEKSNPTQGFWCFFDKAQLERGLGDQGRVFSGFSEKLEV